MPDDSPMKRLQASVQGSLENVQKMADGLQQNIAESPVKERIEVFFYEALFFSASDPVLFCLKVPVRDSFI